VPEPGVARAGVDVGVPAERLWDRAVDWPRQGEWMPLTRVTSTGQPGIGAQVSAFSGIARLGFLDTMVVTDWLPPHRVDVEHTGRVVRGDATLRVLRRGPQRSRVMLEERLAVGPRSLGMLWWPLARPLVELGMTYALRRLARQLEREDGSRRG